MKKGDRVTFVGNDNRYLNHVGTVVAMSSRGDYCWVEFDNIDGQIVCMVTELAPHKAINSGGHYQPVPMLPDDVPVLDEDIDEMSTSVTADVAEEPDYLAITRSFCR